VTPGAAQKVAVVLFNLGGPDSLKAVKPFLFNLFRDPAIIDLPAIVRYPFAALIANARDKSAQANYALMGGATPLLKETQAQAAALEAEIRARASGREAKVFFAMRYWRPFARETVREVAAFAPDVVVLLPLYPQFSTTTTASSIAEFKRLYRGSGVVRTVCCYPTADNVVESHAAAIRETWEAAGRPSIRLLLSAHGLPVKCVAAGDPYQAQVEATAAAITARLPEFTDWQVCYQSRVGRLEWLGPYTDSEVRRAGAEGKGVLIAPIAFVSEHVETLVELDHDYSGLAKAAGAQPYLRSPTPGIRPVFIAGLADAAADAAERPAACASHPDGRWRCPGAYGKCPWRMEEGAS
jgi:ferrochelatase